MENRLLTSSLIAVLLVTGGCTGGGAARVEPAQVMLYREDHGCEADRPPTPGLLTDHSDRRPGAIMLDCFRFPGDPPTAPTAYARAVADPSAVTRNRLAFVLIAQADTICTIEKSLMLERQAEVNGWLSIATTGLSVASTIVTGQQASDILSGGAAFTSGSRDHVNTHVYRNQIIQTVTSAIDGQRTDALKQIRKSLAEDLAGYPVDAAIRDVNHYHQLCSFGYGLQTVMEAVEKQQEYQAALRASTLADEKRRLEMEGGHDELVSQLSVELARERTGLELPAQD